QRQVAPRKASGRDRRTDPGRSAVPATGGDRRHNAVDVANAGRLSRLERTGPRLDDAHAGEPAAENGLTADPQPLLEHGGVDAPEGHPVPEIPQVEISQKPL